jgi:hypothetical protein
VRRKYNMFSNAPINLAIALIGVRAWQFARGSASASRAALVERGKCLVNARAPRG